MINNMIGTKYGIVSSSKFNKQLRRIVKQGRDVNKLKYVVNKLADGMELEERYRDHALKDSRYYKDCRECHIEPDWLLIYQYRNNRLILYLIETGSHSEVFNM